MIVYTNQPIYVYVVNLDERGDFYADVRNARTGETVYEIESDEDGSIEPITDGNMIHKDDLEGLKKYLVSIKIIEDDSALCRVGSETGPVEMDRVLLLDDARGIYIPQAFAEGFDHEHWGLTHKEDKRNLDILIKGPEGDEYWEAWHEVLDRAKATDPKTKLEYTLEQDGDLWAVAYEHLKEGIDATIESPTW